MSGFNDRVPAQQLQGNTNNQTVMSKLLRNLKLHQNTTNY